MIKIYVKNFILNYIPYGILIILLIRKIIFKLSMYRLLYRFKNKIFSREMNNCHHKHHLYLISIFLKKHSYYKNFSNKLTSQLGQELFVLSELKFKLNGYFVEFGVANGIYLSNSYFLEKYLNWQGIVAEPARLHHNKLKENRVCNIDTRCVWNKTGEILDFSETAEPYLSTLTTCIDRDFHKETRKKHILYKVETVTLLDLLKAHNAPKHIDYISIDTQGSEFEILEAFDFTAYDIKIITVEHNYADYRDKIYNLLVAKGYKQVYKEHSQYDDWYVKI